jgi:hypothetical protein
MSFTEAAINDMVCQIHYIRKLFKPLGLDLTRPITLYNNNQSTICIATKATGKIYHRYRGALKHTDLKIKHLHEQVARKTMVIKYCSTNKMPADLLTKGLTETNLLLRIGLKDLPSGE